MLKFVRYFDAIIVIIMAAAYFYQVVYTVTGLIKRRVRPEPEPSKLHRFAALVCARNEAGVIGELVASLKAQHYPSQLLDIYVLADNCTDDTASCAREAGAIVYERRNDREVGKGYALDYLLKRIGRSRDAGSYDAYFVFDADNVVDAEFTAEMNKTFDRGYEIITCYRNSKNFGANWISAGYSIWFLREARFLNYPRMLFGSSCAVSGTGFMVSDKVIRENGGWPFHLLTEDIQFSVDCAVSGKKIGYCDKAVVFDEQPTTFGQSWAQRMRWSKGFYQVDAHYSGALIRGALTGKGNRRSCYDMFMTVAPAMLLTLFAFLTNLIVLFACLTQPYFIVWRIIRRTVRFVCLAMFNFYFGLLLVGGLTVISEWKQIHASPFRKLAYLPLFPLFMATYIPIAIVALVRRVEWKPIRHFSSSEELRVAEHKD